MGLIRNKTKVFYKNQTGIQELYDDYGNATGSYFPIYSELKEAWLSVSPNKGTADTQYFGNLLDYDRVMTTNNINLDIDEQTVLWIDGADTNNGHNFVVERVARSIKSISYAIRQVDVTEVIKTDG